MSVNLGGKYYIGCDADRKAYMLAGREEFGFEIPKSFACETGTPDKHLTQITPTLR